jgi:hypothetical protein
MVAGHGSSVNRVEARGLGPPLPALTDADAPLL